MKRLCAAIIATVLSACTPAPPAPTQAAAPVQDHVTTLWTAETRTVLQRDEALAMVDQCNRASPGPVEEIWTPSDAELDAMESQLTSLVARKLEERGESPSPGGYYRQIAGFVIGGRRIICVNGLDDNLVQALPRQDPSVNWTTDAVGAFGGGSITFGVEYDPATRQFSNFEFNGPP